MNEARRMSPLTWVLMRREAKCLWSVRILARRFLCLVSLRLVMKCALRRTRTGGVWEFRGVCRTNWSHTIVSSLAVCCWLAVRTRTGRLTLAGWLCGDDSATFQMRGEGFLDAANETTTATQPIANETTDRARENMRGCDAFGRAPKAFLVLYKIFYPSSFEFGQLKTYESV